jgi:hypothetical protein
LLFNELNSVEVTENNVVEILSNFAAWMCNLKKSGGDYYAAKTLMQYLSGVKETLLSENRLWMIWFGHDTRSGWYCRLCRGLEGTVGKRVMDAGERLEEVSPH